MTDRPMSDAELADFRRDHAAHMDAAPWAVGASIGNLLARHDAAEVERDELRERILQARTHLMRNDYAAAERAVGLGKEGTPLWRAIAAEIDRSLIEKMRAERGTGHDPTAESAGGS